MLKRSHTYKKEKSYPMVSKAADFGYKLAKEMLKHLIKRKWIF